MSFQKILIYLLQHRRPTAKKHQQKQETLVDSKSITSGRDSQFHTKY